MCKIIVDYLFLFAFVQRVTSKLIEARSLEKVCRDARATKKKRRPLDQFKFSFLFLFLF